MIRTATLRTPHRVRRHDTPWAPAGPSATHPARPAHRRRDARPPRGTSDPGRPLCVRNQPSWREGGAHEATRTSPVLRPHSRAPLPARPPRGRSGPGRGVVRRAGGGPGTGRAAGGAVHAASEPTGDTPGTRSRPAPARAPGRRRGMGAAERATRSHPPRGARTGPQERSPCAGRHPGGPVPGMPRTAVEGGGRRVGQGGAETGAGGPRCCHRRSGGVPRRRRRGASAGLGELLTDIGDQPLERAADEVVRRSTAARQRVDDVAVLPLRARADG